MSVGSIASIGVNYLERKKDIEIMNLKLSLTSYINE